MQKGPASVAGSATSVFAEIYFVQVSLTIFTPGTVQISKTPLSGRVLNLPFLVFFSLCFMARGPRDGYLMSNVLIKFYGIASQLPAVAVFSGDGDFPRA